MVGHINVKKDVKQGAPFNHLANEHSTFWYHGAPNVMKNEHWHNHIEFNFIKQGVVAYNYDGHNIEFPSGQLIFFWGGIPHRMTNFRLSDQKGFYNFHYPLEDFLMVNFDRKLHRLLLSGHILTLKAPDFLIEQYFELWRMDIQKQGMDIFDRINSDIAALFTRFSFETLAFPHGTQPIKSKDITPNMLLFVKIIRYIFEHFQEDIRNTDIAEHLGFHENYIQRVFKDFSGSSIRQFIIHIRLKYACSLLRNTNRSIFNIVIETGFGSTSRFYKAFADTYQQTPKQYRDIWKQEK
ncbi:MAG: helix-turn-helix domain-containing protein [Alphaproteobacteria bacterium]